MIFDTIKESIENTCDCTTCDLSCATSNCAMAFAKDYREKCLAAKAKGIGISTDDIPSLDTKHYEQDEITTGVALMLTLCHDCNSDHTDDCVINVVRSCYEVAGLGEIVEYPGNTVAYLMNLGKTHKELAQEVMLKYQALKK
ncbi:hypothetical protein [Anaerosporobacter faecicola]|uniref:hypothetical protein n=1 Tax=Anaerosporobacter faecicola TaxID=2718714 RepID=UPI00143A9656|nr:hypothetical protein [Anaerosporobacter faecicola]